MGSFANAEPFTYSRGDLDAYLKARGTDATDTHDPSRLKALRRALQDSSIKEKPSFNHDDPQECTLYIAESSIPNAGLGIYTTIPYNRDEQIGHSEIGILLHDLQQHYPSANKEKDMFMNYFWSARNLAGGEFECTGIGSTMIPGIGMLINDHPGLRNVDHGVRSPVIRFWEDADDTLSVEGLKHATNGDVGRGASTSHSAASFFAKKSVEAGDELFISYGPGWFQRRSETMGDIPEENDYKVADMTLKQFMNRAKQDGLDISSPGLQQRYDEMIYKADWLKERPRLKAALPENVADIPTVMEMGTAAYSIMNEKRSVSWIEQNGMCADNMAAGATTIPQAGRGAFALRTFQKDTKLVTAPVITFTLEQLHLRKVALGTDGKEYIIHGGFQQMLNYCYGHIDSSLLFFPAAPTVNFINHGSKEKANAEIRWSTSSNHRAEWLDASLDEMKTKLENGLSFDIVTTKEIKRGEEILLYYGDIWQASWDRHIRGFDSRNNFSVMIGVPTAQDFNQKEGHSVLRTVSEQKTNPYPDHLRTTCFFVPPNSCEPPLDPSLGFKCEVQSHYTGATTNLYEHFKFCEILSRHSTEDDVHWYTANITVTGNGQEYYLVNYLPRYAVRFVNRPYTKDQYRVGSFRQHIGIEENMMPEQWLDLRQKVGVQDEL